MATKDSNPIYFAYGITFFAQTSPQDQNHSFYSEPVLVPAPAVQQGSWYFLRRETSVKKRRGYAK